MVQSGSRPASADMLLRLSQHLHLSDREHRYVSLLNQYSRKPSRELQSQLQALRSQLGRSRRLTEGEMTLLESWFFFAIKQALQARESLTFTQLEGILENKVSRQQIERSAQLLAAMGLCQISKEAIRRLPKGQEDLRTSFDVPSTSIRKFHRNVLARASESLDEQGVLDREFLAATARISKSQIPEFKTRLREFLDQFLADCGTEEADQIYQLGLHFFRVGVLPK